MALRDLNADEIAVVGQCLRAAVEGPFFPDWEFQTLVGLSRQEVRQLATIWPFGDGQNGDTTDAIVSVLNNLLGYPHGKESAWPSFISVAPKAVSTVLEKILARP